MDVLLTIPPWIYLSLVAGSAVAFFYHFALGQGKRSGLFYWPFGMAGFIAGGIVGERIGFDYMVVGEVSMAAGIVGALVGLILARLLLT